METLKLILTLVFVVVCIALTIIVLLQEGKSAGLGAISGMAETYWGKNKGRSMEGALEKLTKALVIGFIVISIILVPISSKVNGTSTESNQTNSSNDQIEFSSTTPDAVSNGAAQ